MLRMLKIPLACMVYCSHICPTPSICPMPTPLPFLLAYSARPSTDHPYLMPVSFSTKAYNSRRHSVTGRANGPRGPRSVSRVTFPRFSPCHALHPDRWFVSAPLEDIGEAEESLYGEWAVDLLQTLQGFL